MNEVSVEENGVHSHEDVQPILRVILQLTEKLEETAALEQYDEAERLMQDREVMFTEAARLKALGAPMDETLLGKIVGGNKRLLDTLKDKSTHAAAQMNETRRQRSIARYQQ
jgi:hypothetical protein